MKVKTCIFPVAGLGTRFLPITKSIPKEMLPVLNKPLIHYSVLEAIESGIERFIFITSSGKHSLEDYFHKNFILENFLEKRGKTRELNLVREIEFISGEAIFIRQINLRGLGDAILCAESVIKDQTFAVMLADDLIISKVPCLKQMMDKMEEKNINGQSIAASVVEKSEVINYGILNVKEREESLLRINSVVEKPSQKDAPSEFAVIGRYIFNHEIFQSLSNLKEHENGEIQLTDSITEMATKIPTYGFLFEGERFDCGRPEGWLKANEKMFKHANS